MTILYRRTDAPGIHYGVPDRDLTADEFDVLPPDLRRDVKASPLYELVDAAALREALTAELNGKTREELNEGAAALGIEDAEKLPNKEAVIDAIVALGAAELGGK